MLFSFGLNAAFMILTQMSYTFWSSIVKQKECFSATARFRLHDSRLFAMGCGPTFFIVFFMILMTTLLQLYLFTAAQRSQSFSGDPLQEQLIWCFDKGSAGNSPIFNRLIIKAALPGLNSARISTTTKDS